MSGVCSFPLTFAPWDTISGHLPTYLPTYIQELNQPVPLSLSLSLSLLSLPHNSLPMSAQRRPVPSRPMSRILYFRGTEIHTIRISVCLSVRCTISISTRVGELNILSGLIKNIDRYVYLNGLCMYLVGRLD
ncbi:hypothetical protein T310_0825 [Rasamsonia emersonii CBS 393.64]|uniref:Uncharacterized protein n=1 Tax=Rasamsonia emersonii (strain ATCC 16479 / CBS 393.64 / IMI 116815) TaxID=1408163 RepID=A0A0F4Z466_RASE3|nr:hypothetical protein T310_0825 [Rasamsonia emersonii CBS 393.64]KKA25120.1 hypothetical protein T310_0825 [Rasamsonia emersonii CBS 393.64]